MKHDSIKLEQVKAYRGTKCVLDIEALQIAKGELVAIIGPNGSGKSTLLQVLNGLLPIQQGTGRLLGVDLLTADTVKLRRRVAMVFQDPLFIHDSVYANVALPLRFRGLTESEVKARVNAALASFRCSHLAKRLPSHLSGGEAQRVCLARAFVTEPEVLLLDEPFSALDPATRNDLLTELKAEALARQTTVLLVSHNLDEVLRFAQRSVVLQEGQIVQDALPEKVLRRPVNSIIARLVGMDNIWACRLENLGEGTQVRVQDQLVFAALGIQRQGKAWCCLPGDSFRFVESEERLDAAWIPLQVQVNDVIPAIGVVQVLAYAGELPVIMRISGDVTEQLTVGQEMKVAFRRMATHILAY